MIKCITTGALSCLLLLLSAFVIDADENNGPFTYGYSMLSGLTQETFCPEEVLEHEEIDKREEGLEMEGRIPMLSVSAGSI